MAQAQAQSDPQRPLTRAGRVDNQTVARQFQQHQPAPEQVWVSPYRRAVETATDVEAVLGPLPCRQTPLLTPTAAPMALVGALDDSHAESVLLVGHNPLLSRFLGLLVDADENYGQHLGTSELVALDLDVVAPGCAQIHYIIRP